jgi:hypothetical protein
MADGPDLLDRSIATPLTSQPESQLSSARCLDLAARLDSEGPPALGEVDVLRMVAGATIDCIAARVNILRAVGRVSDALRLQRSAWRLARSRREAIALTFDAAPRDEDFLRAATDGDAARDRGAWGAAEQHYARGLALYPLHFGYRVQYGHMLKEQTRDVHAEIAYRNALVLGAPPGDVVEHLRFVCVRQEKRYVAPPAPGADQTPMALPPTSLDVEALAQLFWHQAIVDEDEHASILADCTTCEDVALRMIRDRRFGRRNRLLLRLLRDGG